MGAGKSTALAAMPKQLGERVDIDDLIEDEVGMSVREFFDSHGETRFREVEERVAGSLLEKADGGVIALGGGSVLLPRVRKALSRHTVAWLDVSPETAWERVGDSERPLAQDRARFDRLYAERRPVYEELADAKLLFAMSESGGYPVYVGRGLLDAGLHLVGRRAFCVTDRNVAPRYAKFLAAEGILEIDPGEERKTLETAEQVWRAMVDFGLTRHDSVVALGGGVVGDLAGFCAATYQRGMPVVQVPTTLVAQVDSAYGGKTGVDLSEAKNYIGAYHLPEAVVVDLDTLETLPTEELAAGFVEALKTGLLAGGGLWERVRVIESLSSRELDDVVFDCARYKCEVVAEDERDSGLREILNLGHTVGHAIEAASGYGRYRHGEAIGLGLLAVLRLSEAADLRDEVEEILGRHDLPTALDPAIEVDDILDALQRDKKRTAAGVGFVLLSEPGKPRPGQVLDPDAVRAAVLELYG
jgi:shikimate kinase/3-dehydroquinate synthase